MALVPQTRRALIVLDLQNEFLAPTGRSRISNLDCLEAIRNFIQEFRAHGKGDIIWVRSEFSQVRDVDDPRTDEKIFLYEVEGDGEGAKDVATGAKSGKASVKSKTSPQKKKTNTPQEPIDDFLSIHTQPLVAPGSQSAEFFSDIKSSIAASDRVLIKTWYSAFKETPLVGMLRGRFATELYIVGCKSNSSVCATAADAVKHAFKVVVLSDCLGYSHETLHEHALAAVTGELGVDVVRSTITIKSWAVKKVSTATTKKAAKEKTKSTTSKEDLQQMLERLTLKNTDGNNTKGSTDSVGNDPGPEVDAGAEDGKDEPPAVEVTNLKQALELVKRIQYPGRSTSGTQEQTPPPSLPPSSQPNPHTPSSPGSVKPSSSGATSPSSPNPKAILKKKKTKQLDANGVPVLKPGDKMGEGDTRLVADILPEDLSRDVFDRLKREVHWRKMSHRGGEVPRLVAVQGEIQPDGSIPIYRHPADESPPLSAFTPTVSLIREHVQNVLQHPVNHVLIQYYRGGTDYISEHSDKTLDIVRGSNIVNVSLGAQRTMILRGKRDSTAWMAIKELEHTNPEEAARRRKENEIKSHPLREQQRVPLPHNSMFILGEETNKKWMHAIKLDKRLPSLKSPAELAYNGERISLTFRNIGTFLSDHETKIWGQGATQKKLEDARPIIENDETAHEQMLIAFGTENHQADEFVWDDIYGKGFDVLHYKNRLPKLLYRTKDVACARVMLALAEKQVDFEAEEDNTDATQKEDGVSFIDSDIDKTIVEGSMTILRYLEAFYSGDKALGGLGKPLYPLPQRYDRGQYANIISRLVESEGLRVAVEAYQQHQSNPEDTEIQRNTPTLDGQSEQVKNLLKQLDTFETHLHTLSLGAAGVLLGAASVTPHQEVLFGGAGNGKSFWSIADCAIWPILWKLNNKNLDSFDPVWGELEAACGVTESGKVGGRWGLLKAYYERGSKRDSTRSVLAVQEEKDETYTKDDLQAKEPEGHLSKTVAESGTGAAVDCQQNTPISDTSTSTDKAATIVPSPPSCTLPADEKKLLTKQPSDVDTKASDSPQSTTGHSAKSSPAAATVPEEHTDTHPSTAIEVSVSPSEMTPVAPEGPVIEADDDS